MRKLITGKDVAPSKGPYSPAILASGPTVYISGQVPIDPQTGEFVKGSFARQAEQAFDNVTTLLEAAGTAWQQVVRVGIYMADLQNFGELNQIYSRYISEPYPARTTIQAGLPPGVALEVDCIALLPED